MQRSQRLTGSKRFSQIHTEGSSVAYRLLVMRYLANETDYSRFGFLVNKRIGNATKRNKVKRRLRDAVRMNLVKAGWDALFIVRRGGGSANYQDLKDATDNLLQRANLLEKPPQPTGSGLILERSLGAL